MASLNKVHLIGNLTRDPELKFTPKGTAVAEMGLAINRVWKDDNNQKQEETTFVDVTLWGRTAELAGQYLSKGSSCYVEGRLTMDSWEDKVTGQKRSKLKVVGENIQFLGAKGDGQKSDGLGARSSEYGQREQPPQGRSSEQNGAQPPQRDNSATDADLDDVPFARKEWMA